MRVRQIFYRLVGVYEYEKTERAYDRLGEMVNKARRARMIEMDALRDDGGRTEEPWAHAGPEDFLASMRARGGLPARPDGRAEA